MPYPRSVKCGEAFNDTESISLQPCDIRCRPPVLKERKGDVALEMVFGVTWALRAATQAFGQLSC